MPEDKWTTVRILVDSDVNRRIKKSNTSAFKTLEQMSLNEPKTKEEKANSVFEKFVHDINDLYPGNKTKLGMLWPIIASKIIKTAKHKLSDTYFDNLKEMLDGEGLDEKD